MKEIENTIINGETPPARSSENKPWRQIHIAPGAVNDNLREAIAGLAETGEHFQSAGRIVTLREGADGDLRIEPLSDKGLYRALDKTAQWLRFNKRSNEWFLCEPPLKYCRMLSEPAAHAGLPMLRGIARQPYLCKDGSICAAAGYDASSGLFGAFKEAEYEVAPAPSRADAEQALKLLDQLLAEFEFADHCDRSAALSAILTATVRPALPVAPMYHVKASQIGSGKSFLCELIGSFATETPISAMSFPSSSEECAKLLTAELMRSPAVLQFDNLTSDIVPHKSLCSALTGEFLRNRVLRHTRMIEVGTRTLMLSSGNNVGPIKDMTRRCITIRLDPKHEMPATRTFARPNLVSEVKASRGKYLSAALTIVRAWIAAGSPNTTCKALAGYPDWTDWCRQPLLWLGLEDPAKHVFAAMAHDPDREVLGQLLRELELVFGKAHFLVKTVIERAQDGSVLTQDLLEILQEIAPARSTIDRRQLGQWFKAHSGQWVDGRKLEEAPVKRNAVAWQVTEAPSAGATITTHAKPTTMQPLMGEGVTTGDTITVSANDASESVASVKSVENTPTKFAEMDESEEVLAEDALGVLLPPEEDASDVEEFLEP